MLTNRTDTVMSRMYNQSGNLYSGIFDCLKKTIKTEGILAIYKGYFAHLARILPHTVSFLSPYIYHLLDTNTLKILTLTLAEQTNKWVRGIEQKLFLN